MRYEMGLKLANVEGEAVFSKITNICGFE